LKFIDEFRRSDLAKGIVTRINQRSKTNVRFMEFCGGHTVAIFKYGIRQLLPPSIEMVSGPGCPVCVTANSDIDKCIAFSQLPGVIVATFGDMLKVPGSRSSLQRAKAEGADVRMVYSAIDALGMAQDNPDKSVVFLGIGFETTAPTIAASILQAQEQKIKNYFVFSMHKLTPPVVKAVLDAGEVKIGGIVCPGHVSVITGSQAWEFIAKDYGIPCVVSGFEPLDILQCVSMLVDQVESGCSKVEIAYIRGVCHEGNTEAQKLMHRVFQPSPAEWRGIGSVPGSGLKLNEKYARFDAERVFHIDHGESFEPAGCICGEVLRGVKTPHDCALFGGGCTPQSPVGPCMVSSEGTCAAYYLYGGDSRG
jgi:hydrogenase expression/formation protein HypD